MTQNLGNIFLVNISEIYFSGNIFFGNISEISFSGNIFFVNISEISFSGNTASTLDLCYSNKISSLFPKYLGEVDQQAMHQKEVSTLEQTLQLHEKVSCYTMNSYAEF